MAGPAAKLKTRSEKVEGGVWRGVVVVEAAAEQEMDIDLYVVVKVVMGWRWVVGKVADLRVWWVVLSLRRKDWVVAADIAMAADC